MKTLEKLILCCIWICIALVLVLIKDQMELNQKILENTKVEFEESEERNDPIMMDETAVMNFVAENLPVMKQAEIQFQSDGHVELRVEVNDEILQEVSMMTDHEMVGYFLPMLKGIEVGCKAFLSADEISVKECQAGVFTIPQSLLELMSQKINEMWDKMILEKGIRELKVSEEGIAVTLQQD